MIKFVLNYRPDIDLLRAIAVVSVLIFHTFPSYAKSGYIGVDVFFVISGYLVSKLIITNPEFSFKKFYSSRIDRLLPSLIIIIIFCLISGWYILSPIDLYKLSTQIVAAVGFFSNFFYLSETGYFDSDHLSKPLLHLWSLGLEAQFYILWPILLIYLKIKNKSTRVLQIILLVSFILFIGLYKFKPDASFYLLFTRLWELGAGYIIAYYDGYLKKSKNIIQYISLIFLLIGLLFIP